MADAAKIAKSLDAEQAEALCGDSMAPDVAAKLKDLGLVKVYENLSGGAHGYGLTELGERVIDALGRARPKPRAVVRRVG